MNLPGIYPPMVTPFTDDRVDMAGFKGGDVRAPLRAATPQARDHLRTLLGELDVRLT